MAGTFTVSAANVTTPIDSNCVLQSLKLVSAPSGALQPMSYDPVQGYPNGGNTFCLCTGNANDNTLRQFYNMDVWNTGWKGTTIPITPQPPSAVPLYSIFCTACPPGCSVELVTA
jgi:hypothetical protein